MAKSNCGRCGSTKFELTEKSDVDGSAFRIMFVQCASCGAVIGTVPYHNTAVLLSTLASALGVKLEV